MIYAYSWYLDIVCDNWDALVEGDYETVMPITAKEKYKIKYLYQPFFTQQLGVFSTKVLSNEKVEQFLTSIPKEFKFIDICLNKFNKVEKSNFSIKKNVTYELDLIEQYEKLHKNFSTNTKRNIRKAIKNEIKVSKGLPPNELIKLFRENRGKTVTAFKEEDYNNLRKIIAQSLRYNIGEIFTAYTKENNLCAAAFFIVANNKSIFLFSGLSDEGKDYGAMFLVISEYIKTHSELNLTLDFEGSNDENLARFYKGFGSQKFNYLSLKKNKLPWYIKLLKR